MDAMHWLVIGSIACALAFDVINGFHDAANSIATVVSTRVLSPRIAVLWAAFFNFIAMFVFAPKVADAIAKIVDVDRGKPIFVLVVLCGLLGAIFWDLLTWWWGLPTSSSHALIGGFVGSGLAFGGWKIIHWDTVGKTALFIPIAPLMGFVMAFLCMFSVLWMFRRWRPQTVDKLFRKGQLLSAGLYSLGHGGNDAQKTMGIIMALLIAEGTFTRQQQLSLTDPRTAWIVLSCFTAMGVGTALGGWRIVKTMGMKMTKLRPVGGFCAETAGAATLVIATVSGIPVSTTHTIAGGIVGVGATTNLSGIKWGVAMRIVWAWILTIPCSALVGAGTFYVISRLVSF